MDAAEEAFKQAIAIQADNVNALNSLGSLYYSKGANTMKTDVEKQKLNSRKPKNIWINLFHCSLRTNQLKRNDG